MQSAPGYETGETTVTGFRLRFTPAEWHNLLQDPSFLEQPDNAGAGPRRLMGVPVTIIPEPYPRPFRWS